MVIEKLDCGKDLISEIEKVCKKRNVKTGWFNAIGALKNVTYGFYDQKMRAGKLTLGKLRCQSWK